MQHRNVDLQEVFKYPLGAIALVAVWCWWVMQKKNKAAILHHVKKTPHNCYTLHITMLQSLMVWLQYRKQNGLTFQRFADHLLELIISASWLARRIGIVFDVNRDSSIKNAERMRSSTGKLEFSSIGTNKTSLMTFLKKNEKKENICLISEDCKFSSCADKSVLITMAYWWENVNELDSNQEEANTRLLLHSQHVSRNGFDDIVIHTPDTDRH